MLFKSFAEALQDIESVSSRLSITEKLAKLFGDMSKEEIAIAPYLMQGRVAPAFSGIEFGMAEKSVIKAAALAMQIDHTDFIKEVQKVGDLGQAVEKARDSFISFEQKELTILEVFEELSRIARTSGEGSQETKSKILALLFTQLDPLSCRFLARIPLGQMRLGASDVTVIDALSWMIGGDKSLRAQIEKAYQVRPDLGFISALVKSDGVKSVDKVHPVVGTPILMMKAERLSSGAEIIEKIGPCFLEPKYDGLRLQVHISNSTSSLRGGDSTTKQSHVEIFTRGLEQVTHMYPDIVAAVQKDVTCTDCILEGEALGYDTENDKFLPFQETIQRKRKHDVAEAALRIPLRLMTFDLLYLDGESILQQPLTFRKEKLASILSKQSEILKLSPVVEVDQPQDIEKYFDEYIAEGLEGIMAKKKDSVYKPGAREYSWVKLKRSYSAKVNDTIDCVVMGYDAGKGKRADFGIGAVMVGVYDPETAQYLTIAKIGTGMTDEEWRELRVKSKEQRAKEKPENYKVAREMTCDFWVNPAIVIEIRCDEVTKSKLHTSGLSLRFPRLERFRDDKRAEDATTLAEIQKMVGE